MLATVWGHVRYRTDDYSERCYSAVRARPHGVERGCCAWRHPGLVVKHGAAQQLYAGTVCSSGHTLMSMCIMSHIESRMVHRGCRVEDRIGM